MFTWLTHLFDDSGFLPHEACFRLRPDVVWMHVASDAIVALAYFMIPATLVYLFIRKRLNISFSWAIVFFAAFILLCGLSHVMDIIVIWKPVYYLQGVVKAMTAVISILTAFAIIPLAPRLARMRSPEELERANARLQEEVEARSKAEQELKRSVGELNRAVSELEQFAYIASHDLQAPLRSVSGFAQLLSRRYSSKLEGDAVEFLKYIESGTKHMQRLIQDLLMLSRIGRATDARRDERPLGATVQEAIGKLRADIQRNGAQVECQDLPNVVADHQLLEQLFQNLISNAIKFQPRDDSGKPTHTPVVDIRCFAEGPSWHIVVADNGIGIPKEQAENVFAVFRRLHSDDKYEGTGIGLSICRKIARYHDGEVWASARSGPDGGTEFHLRLPIRAIHGGPKPQPVDLRSPDLAPA